MKKIFNNFDWAGFFYCNIIGSTFLLLAIAMLPIWREPGKKYLMTDQNCWFYAGFAGFLWLFIVVISFIFSRNNKY
jgi:hypothetical protein